MSVRRSIILLCGTMGLFGCTADLPVVEGAQISCAGDGICPKGYICAVDRCVSRDANQPPRVVIGIPERTVDTVEIPVTVSDFEGDVVTFSVSYSDAGVFVPATVDPLEVATTAEGVAATLVWHAATDLASAAYVSDMVVEITPSGGSPTLSAPFAFGNDAPEVNPMPVSGTKSGDVGIAYVVTDSASDLAAVDVQFSTNMSGPWSAASITLGPTASLSTSPAGIEHAVIWNSREAPNADPLIAQGIGAGPAAIESEVYIRLLATDTVDGVDFDGAEVVIGPFAVDNTINAPPSIQVTTPTGTQSGTVLVSYLLLDAESDVSELVVEFNGGAGFVPVTEATGQGDGTMGLVSSPTGTAHVFAWDTVADRVALSAVNPNVILRFAARGITQGVFTATTAITVDNQVVNQDPVLSVFPPSGVASGDMVGIPFSITDDEGDPCDLEVEYEGSPGAWVTATPDTGTPLTGLISSPSGALHTFVWQSLTDQVAPSQTTINMRIRVTQPSPARDSGWIPFSVVVDNGANLNVTPEAILTSAGPVAVYETDYEFYLLVRDTESDDVVVDEVSFTVNGTAWLSATTDAEAQILATTPSGILYALTWEAATDIQEAKALLGTTPVPMLSLRVRVSDDYGQSSYAVHNQDLASLEVVPSVSPPLVPIDSGNTAGLMAGLVSLGGGEVHAFWNTPFGAPPYVIRHSVSYDSGTTWEPDNITISGVEGDDATSVGFGNTLLVAYGNDVSTLEQLRVRRSTNGGTAWSTINITTGANETGNPHFYHESGNIVHLVWRDYNSPNSRVYHARSINGGASWSSPVDVSGLEAIQNPYPAVGVTGGTIFVTWVDGTGVLQYATSVNNGTTWSAPSTLDTSMAGSSGYSFINTPDGALHLIGEHTALRYQRRTAAGVWEGEVILEDLGVTRPPFGFYDDTTGRLSIYYMMNTNPGFEVRVVTSDDNGSTFSDSLKVIEDQWDNFAVDPQSKLLTVGTVGQFGLPARYPFAVPLPHLGLSRTIATNAPNALPAVGPDGNGGLFVVHGNSSLFATRKAVPWQTVGDTFNEGYGISPTQASGAAGAFFAGFSETFGMVVPNTFFSVAGTDDDGSTWNPLNTLTRGGTVAVDNAGTGHIVTIGASTAPTTLAHRLSVDGGATWNGATSLGSLGTQNLSPYMRGYGDRLHLVYVDTSGTPDVIRYSNSSNGTAWSTATNVSQNSVDAVFPKITGGAHGFLYIVWSEPSGGSYQVRLAMSDDDGATWSAPMDAGTQLLCNGCESTLEASADPAADVFIAWRSDPPDNLPRTAVSRDMGFTWGEPETHDASGSSFPQIASSVDGTYVTWAEFSSQEVRFRAMRSHTVLHASPTAPSVIPGSGTLTSRLNVGDGGTIADVGVWVDLQHPDAQLRITLTSPSGGMYTIVDGGASRVWDGSIVFRDDGIPPLSSLAPLYGASLMGDWVLTVTNTSAATGTLRDWGLRFR